MGAAAGALRLAQVFAGGSAFGDLNGGAFHSSSRIRAPVMAYRPFGAVRLPVPSDAVVVEDALDASGGGGSDLFVDGQSLVQ